MGAGAGGALLAVAALSALAGLSALARPAAAQAAAQPAASGTDVSVAWVTVAGVLGAGVLSFVAAVVAARSQLRGVQATAEAAYQAAFTSAETQLQTALTAAAAQQATIERQLDEQRQAQRVARLDELADHRRLRHEATVESLQDAIADLAVLVDQFARERTRHAAKTKRWEDPPGDFRDRLYPAQVTAYKLVQRLPPGDRADTWEDETWKRVKDTIGEHQEDVVRSRSAADQEEALDRFKAAVVVAQDALGQAFDKLDRQLSRRLPG